MDFYGFYTGKEFHTYQFLGCHITQEGIIFRTFAPNAEKVTLIGDFNHWVETPMKRIYDGNFWECTLTDASIGERYKYRIYKEGSGYVDHCDPYGFQMELPPAFASVIVPLASFQWTDQKWLQTRTDHTDQPLNIYELHFGSWRKREDQTSYSYRELAEPLIRYVKANGYNYIEIMPLAEHPCDNSWGYQQTGFYSPTSRYGTPNDLRYFINYAHRHGVGVILDFVPVHFAVDDYGLADYDGTALYEYPHTDVGISEWGSKNFNHSRGEVQSFLHSNAQYWLKEFHFDGLRIDALSNIIYWHGNKDRGVNLRAVEFIQNMNQTLKQEDASIMLIAEDSTAYEGVTKPVDQGGLGFDYKWDMGWMNDTLNYFKTSPSDRVRDYHKLTFSMMYFYSERFLLPLSHDETVHGKATILQKMYGDYEIKFPQARALYLYMYTHPGKKLNFMGNEFGQLREWDEAREQDWSVKEFPLHAAFARYMRDLNRIYLKHEALYLMDDSDSGFQWVDCHQEDRCLYLFERRSPAERILVVLNFSDQLQEYTISRKTYPNLTPLLASDRDIYGGTRTAHQPVLKRTADSITIKINAYSGMMFLVKN